MLSIEEVEGKKKKNQQRRSSDGGIERGVLRSDE